jgi:pimeloyl-ACP methyl ester carboxylesterase
MARFEYAPISSARVTSASGLDDVDVVIVLPLSNDTQVFCVEFAKKQSCASRMLVCIPEGDDGRLYCRSARETYGVATVKLPVRKLVQGEECRFGVDIIKHCADDLMKKVATSVRKLRIEKTVVVLIHGIRTRAVWQGQVRKALEDSGLVALPTNYNKLDVLRFMLPFKNLKLAPFRRVEADIISARKKFQDGHISLLAHSFGTYITGQLLSSEKYSFDRVVLCGSVLRSDFDFDSADSRFNTIVNEIGCRDIWPALAAKISRAYGPTGSFGFNRGNFVEDRKHAKSGHSHFLNREFCERFWIPYFCDGRRDDAGDVDATPSRLVRFVDGIWFTILLWGCAALLAALPLWWLISIFIELLRLLFP